MSTDYEIRTIGLMVAPKGEAVFSVQRRRRDLDRGVRDQRRQQMKRETGTALYFYMMLAGAIGWSFAGQPIAAAVMAAAAGVIGAINFIARDYFDGL